MEGNIGQALEMISKMLENEETKKEEEDYEKCIYRDLWLSNESGR